MGGLWTIRIELAVQAVREIFEVSSRIEEIAEAYLERGLALACHHG
jgi:hypothetical protein